MQTQAEPTRMGAKQPVSSSLFAIMSLLLNGASALAIGFSNADRYHAGIHSALPWTRGDCAIWSGWAFLAVFGVAVAAVALGIKVRLAAPSHSRHRAVGTALAWAAGAQVVYWLFSAFGNFAVTCIA